MFRNRFVLILISAIAVIDLLLGFFGARLGVGSIVIGVLLVLVLPGYVLSRLMLPELTLVERLLVTLGLSIVIVGLSGMLLNFTPWSLNPSTWSIWLGLFTLVGAGLLWVKKDLPGPAQTPPPGKAIFAWNSLHWQSFFLYGASLALVGLAIFIARGNASHIDIPLTNLWANTNTDPSQPGLVTFGVQNLEQQAMTYNLVILQNGVKVKEWDGIQLDNGQTYSGQYTFQKLTQQPIQVLLYRAQSPSVVYREVKVVLPEVSEQFLLK